VLANGSGQLQADGCVLECLEDEDKLTTPDHVRTGDLVKVQLWLEGEEPFIDIQLAQVRRVHKHWVGVDVIQVSLDDRMRLTRFLDAPKPYTSKNRLYSTTFSFEHSLGDPIPLPATAETTGQTRPASSDSPGSVFSGQNKGPTPFGAEPSLRLSRGGRSSRCLKHGDHTAPCTSADQGRTLVLCRKNHSPGPAVMSDSPGLWNHPTLPCPLSPLPRRHRLWISPQAFPRLSCVLLQPFQHYIPWCILPIPLAPVVLDEFLIESHAIGQECES
jgi:hypothetical protein